MAYIKEILKNSADSHQASPGYVITFVRWSNRDVFNYTSPTDANSQDTREPFVVVNDATSVSVTNSKEQLSANASITLKGGDINYATAVHPGDFVLINMLNWKTDAERIRLRALDGQAINGPSDGFKGIFKIQSVVKSIKINPTDGKKMVSYIVTAAGFTELNNVMYFNPLLAAEFKNVGTLLYQTKINDVWANKIKSIGDIQDIFPVLFKILLGDVFGSKDILTVKDFGTTHFKMPSGVGKLLGVSEAKYAADIYNFIVGIWKDSTSAANMAAGFNPGFENDAGEENFFQTGVRLQGNKLITLDTWNQVTSWSILNGYLNPALNEMYTTFRINKFNRVMPTIVVRQKPFSSDHFEAPTGFPVSRHKNQPRWKVNADMVFEAQLGRNDAARFNFVQVFSSSIPSMKGQDYAQQIALKNFVEDTKDIERNGLRPYITSSNFDDPTGFKSGTTGPPDIKRIRAKEWAQIVSDWVIDGHLRESGHFVLYGVQDPISVGDNFEFDGIIYHIESLSDSMVISGEHKIFRTVVKVSFGMDLRSSKNGPIYPQMTHTDAHAQNIEDWDNERILPGISDTQDLPGSKTRKSGEETSNTPNDPFTPPRLGRRKNQSSTPKSVTDLKKIRK